MPITADAQYKGCPTTTRPVRRPQWNGKRVSSAPFQSTCLLASADQYRCLLSARNIHTLSPLAGLIEYRLRRANIGGRLRAYYLPITIAVFGSRLLQIHHRSVQGLLTGTRTNLKHTAAAERHTRTFFSSANTFRSVSYPLYFPLRRYYLTTGRCSDDHLFRIGKLIPKTERFRKRLAKQTRLQTMLKAHGWRERCMVLAGARVVGWAAFKNLLLLHAIFEIGAVVCAPLYRPDGAHNSHLQFFYPASVDHLFYI